MVQNDVLDTAKMEGREEEKLDNARQLRANGVAVDLIAGSLGLDEDVVRSL